MTGLPSRTALRIARQRVERLAGTEPDVVSLAEALSLAVVVDPALIRAARLRFTPRRGPDLEADLWHSALVASSNHAGLVIDDDVAEYLRWRLAEHPDHYEGARRLIARAHDGEGGGGPGWLPDTLRLEEELRFLALVPGGWARARRLLAAAAAQLDPTTDGLEAWLGGLWSRLPLTLRTALADVDGGPEPAIGGAWAGWAARSIGIRLLDGAVEIRPPAGAGDHRLHLPAGPLPAVFVDRRLVPLDTLPHLEPLADPAHVVVQTLDGTRLDLRRGRRRARPDHPARLRHRPAPVVDAALDVDATTVATVGADRVARLWDLATGIERRALGEGRITAHACSLAADGSVLAVGGDGAVHLFDPATGRLAEVLDAGGAAVRACAFSPDLDLPLLAAGDDDGQVRLWDPAAGVVLRDGADHRGAVRALAFSTDGHLLVSAGDDGKVRLGAPTAPTRPIVLERGPGDPGAPVGAVALSAGARPALVAAGTDGGELIVGDARQGAVRRVLTDHRGAVRACAFSPDGTLLASAGDDRTVRVWDPAAGELLRSFPGHRGPVRWCAFTADGRRLASAGDDRTVRFWEPGATSADLTFTGHTSWVRAGAWSPDGAMVATAGEDRTARLWDPTTGAPGPALAGHDDWVLAVAVSPGADLVATASRDGTVRVWDGASGRERHRITGHADWVRACAFSPRGDLLASAGDDGACRLWEPRSGRSRGVLPAHDDLVLACAFSPVPGPPVLATASQDQTARLWDPSSGALRAVLSGHIREVQACAFSPDGATLATASADQTVRLWDTVTGAPRATLVGHENRVNGCAFSPDGTVLATASSDRTVRLWDWRTGSARRVITGAGDQALSCAWAPDGIRLLTTGTDPVARVWDLTTGRPAGRGEVVALWLGGEPGDEAAVAGAMAARPLIGRCTPVVAAGAGAVPGVLLAAGVDPRMVQRLATSPGLLGRARPSSLVRRLSAQLASAEVELSGHLSVAVPHPLFRHRYQAVAVDAATDRLVVLPRDAHRLGLDPDDLPLAELAVIASGWFGPKATATLAGRDFRSAVDRSFDPAPWYDGAPPGTVILAIDVEDRRGTVPARRFGSGLRVTSVTIPWLHLPSDRRPGRRHREVLARIGAQTMRRTLSNKDLDEAARRDRRTRA